MKYLVILALLIAGCTSEKSPNTTNVVGLKSELQETKFELDACKVELSNYKLYGSSSSPSTQSEPEETSGPQYEEVNAFHVMTKYGNTVCYERNDSDGGADIACGMTFSDCKDGYVYRCMIDVKYKVVKEQKLIEQE